MIIIKIVILLLFFVVIYTSKSTIERANGLKVLAQKAQNDGDHGSAGNCYFSAAEAYEKSGNSTKAKEAYGNAVMEYEQAAQESTRKRNHYNASSYYSMKAEAYEKLGFTQKAKEAYNDAVLEYENNEQEVRGKRDSEYMGNYYYLVAEACQKSGKNEKARKMYLDASREYNKARHNIDAKSMHIKAIKLSFWIYFHSFCEWSIYTLILCIAVVLCKIILKYIAWPYFMCKLY